jgi:hypothetical protein
MERLEMDSYISGLLKHNGYRVKKKPSFADTGLFCSCRFCAYTLYLPSIGHITFR